MLNGSSYLFLIVCPKAWFQVPPDSSASSVQVRRYLDGVVLPDVVLSERSLEVDTLTICCGMSILDNFFWELELFGELI